MPTKIDRRRFVAAGSAAAAMPFLSRGASAQAAWPSPTEGEPPRIGVLVQTAVDELLLPIDITLTPGVRIGGPSAGLMVGLTVYDLVADEDLLRGRRVAGTGTLDIDGVVGPVGGVPEKTLAAIAAGYDVLLVPAAETAATQRLADGRIDVIGVATLDEAIDRLRRRR